jgi:hypothetical protein
MAALFDPEQLPSDEFSRYCPRRAGTATISYSLVGQSPSIREWAFDTLSCPAISCECERAFNSAKGLITPDRNALRNDLIEALECLKAWWDNRLILRH